MMKCDVVTDFEPVDWFTMKPVAWCGKPAIHNFQSKDGQTHGICQEHFDLLHDGSQIMGLDGEVA